MVGRGGGGAAFATSAVADGDDHGPIVGLGIIPGAKPEAPRAAGRRAGQRRVSATGGGGLLRGLAAALAWGAAGIAMGTRFLMTAKSPVPRSTLAKYQEVQDAARIRASTAVDGMPQRMIDNPYLEKLEGGSGLRRLFVALASAWRWKQRTGMSVLHMLR